MSALTSLLVRDDVVSVRQIEEALERHVVDAGELDTAILELTDIPENVLTAYRAASERARPVARDEVMGASAATRALLDPELAIALRVMPFAHDHRTLSVAVVNPLGAPEEAALQAQSGLQIAWRISSELRVEAALSKFYGAPLPPRFAALLPRVDARDAGEVPEVEPLQVTPFAALSSDLLQGFDDSVDFETALEAAFDRVSAAPLPLVNLVPASGAQPIRPPPIAASTGSRARSVPPARSSRLERPEPRVPAPRPAPVAESPNLSVGEGAPAAPGRKRVPTLRRGQARIPQGPLTPAMAEEALAATEERDAVVEVFFRFARQYFDTTVLFALRDDRALGLDAYNASALVDVRDVSMAILRGSAVEDMQRSLLPRVVDLSRKDEDRMLALVLKRLSDQPCALIPVCVKRRVVSFVYGDRAGERFRLDDLAPLLGLLPHVSRAFERIIRTRKALGLNARRELVQPRDRALQHAQTQRAYDLPAGLPRQPSLDFDDSSIALAEERTRNALNSLGVPRSAPPPPEPRSQDGRSGSAAARPPTAAGGAAPPMDAREYWAPSRSMAPAASAPALRPPGSSAPPTAAGPVEPPPGPHGFAPPMTPRSPLPPEAGRYLSKSERSSAPAADAPGDRYLTRSSLPPMAPRSPLPPGAGRYMSRAARSALPPEAGSERPQPSAARSALPPEAGSERPQPSAARAAHSSGGTSERPPPTAAREQTSFSAESRGQAASIQADRSFADEPGASASAPPSAAGGRPSRANDPEQRPPPAARESFAARGRPASTAPEHLPLPAAPRQYSNPRSVPQPSAVRTLPPEPARYMSGSPNDPARPIDPHGYPTPLPARAPFSAQDPAAHSPAGKSPLPPAAGRAAFSPGRARSSAPPSDAALPPTRSSLPPTAVHGILPPTAARRTPLPPSADPHFGADPHLLADQSSGLSLALPDANAAEQARTSLAPGSAPARLSNPPPPRYFSRPPAGAGRYSSIVTPPPEPGEAARTARKSPRPPGPRPDDDDTQPLRPGRNFGPTRQRAARSSAPAPRSVPPARASVHPSKPAPGTGSYYAQGLTTEVISVPEELPAVSAPVSQRPPPPAAKHPTAPPLTAASDSTRGASSDVIAELSESAAATELVGSANSMPRRPESPVLARGAVGVRSYPTARDPELARPAAYGGGRSRHDDSGSNRREDDPTLAQTQPLAAGRGDATLVAPLADEADEPLRPDAEHEPRQQIDALILELCASRSEQDSPALTQLRELGEPALNALLVRFPGPLWFDRRRPHARIPLARDIGPIARALVSFGEVALTRLPALLGSPDTETRYYATLFASERVHPALLAPLLERLFDEDAQIRLLVRDALPHYRRVPGFKRLPERLRAHAASAEAPLRARLAALDAIGVLRDAGSVETLIELVAHPDKQLCVPAHRALVGITCQDFDKSTKKWRAWYADNSLRHRVEWLIDGLLHSEQSLRAAAGVELQKVTQVYYGYVAAAPKRDRELAQKRYLDWWRTEGHRKFAS